MLLFIKIAGLAVIFFTCIAFGFNKSHNIRKRAEILNSVYRSVTVLAECIKSEGGEINTVLFRSFTDNFADIKNNKIVFKKDYLENADIDLLTEFFSGLGYTDKSSEYERTKLFASLIKKQSEEAEFKADGLCKLYNTVGFLSGALVCIFFI